MNHAIQASAREQDTGIAKSLEEPTHNDSIPHQIGRQRRRRTGVIFEREGTAGGGAYLPVELGGGVELLPDEYLREAGGVGMLLRAGKTRRRHAMASGWRARSRRSRRLVEEGRRGGAMRWRAGGVQGHGDRETGRRDWIGWIGETGRNCGVGGVGRS
jgi:hypothetical protein